MYPPTNRFSSSLTYRTIVLALHYCTITIVLHVDRKRDHCHGNGHFHHNSPFCVLISTHHITSRLHGKYLLVSPLFPSPLMPSSSSCLPRASPTSSPVIPCTLIYPSLLIFPSPLPILHPFLLFLFSLPLRLLLSCLSSSSPSYPAAYHSSLFASRSHLVDGEEVESYRVAQVLTILQNLSFEESSCEYLAGHEGVRK